MFDSMESAKIKCDKERAGGAKIVLVTGFFDLLHAEHIQFLTKAKNTGDVLVAAVESDARARKVKGADRPVETQTIRCRRVGKYADIVIALSDDFDSQEAYETLIAQIRPLVYAVSSHTSYQENKKLLTEKYGGRLMVVHKWNPATSTTQIVHTRSHTRVSVSNK